MIFYMGLKYLKNFKFLINKIILNLYKKDWINFYNRENFYILGDDNYLNLF
jgi:hypothetical protein